MQQAAKPKLFLFPGMGGDHRLVEPQRAIEGVDVVAPTWIEPRPRESLASYARRQAAALDQSSPFYLGGISFGGMVAYEAAAHCGPNLRGVILISTCRSDRGIPASARLLGRCVAPLLPRFAIRAGKAFVPLIRKRFGVVTREQAVLFDAMLRDTSPAFLKWSLRAVLAWPGPAEPPKVPVLHVHGSADRVLLCRRGSPDHVIDAAGHIMNVTHAQELNRVVSEWVRRVLADKKLDTPS